jgi:hypothetical protein
MAGEMAGAPPYVEDEEGSGGGGGFEGEDEEEEGPVRVLPRYAIPNITSILPEYSNAEQEYIQRTFAQGNYDLLHSLPADISAGEVNKFRKAHMEQARKMLLDNMPHAAGSIPKATNKHGLFQEFEYKPSPYSLSDDIQSRERLENEAARIAIACHDFRTGGAVFKSKYEDGFTEGVRYPHQANPYEAATDQILRHKWLEESKILAGPFVPSGTTNEALRTGAPTKMLARDIIQQVQRIICEDWEDVEVAIYVNEDEHWVVRFPLDAVDSDAGLVAYMNVLVRTNAVVVKYQLVRAVEHWNVRPGDGHVYFTLRPPWLKVGALQATYVLHPEERIFQGAGSSKEAETKEGSKADHAAGGAPGAGRKGSRGQGLESL